MNKKTLIFLLLSILILFLYTQFILPLFVKPVKPAAVNPALSQPDISSSTAPISPTIKSELKDVNATILSTIHPKIDLEKRTIETNYLKAVFSNRGACLESLVLKKYEAAEKKESLELLRNFQSDKYSLTLKQLLSSSSSTAEMETINWEILPGEVPGIITFRYTTPEGLVLKKIFQITENSYAIDVKIILENTSGQPITTAFQLTGAAGVSYERIDRSDLVGMRGYTDKNKKWGVKNEITVKQLKKDAQPYVLTKDKAVEWTGVANKYFAAVLIPKSLTDTNTFTYTSLDDTEYLDRQREKLRSNGQAVNEQTLKDQSVQNISSAVETTPLVIASGETKALEFIFFAGPKEARELAVFKDRGLDKLLDYGWFDFISYALLKILFAFYGIFKNYGWSIIFLTVLVKLILFPITRKGQVSMYKMQKLQPHLKALQEKYKNDKQRLGLEQLKLWKEHGVNPLSGCLPMFFQIPVFIGLYWGLDLCIELRHAPFMLWINNLSQPDHLLKLPEWFQSVPIIGTTYLHLLPLLMTASWIIQSLTQPKSPDPQARQQQKMFTFMPLFFLLLFYNVPSGLTLYWFTSTLLGIAEQMIIKKVYMR